VQGWGSGKTSGLSAWTEARLIISLPASGKTAGKDTFTWVLGTLKKKKEIKKERKRKEKKKEKKASAALTDVAEVHFASTLLPRV